MRRVRNIEKEENFRIETLKGFEVIRRDSIEPETIGTIILTAFRITGYDKDCDGSLMARLEHIDKNGEPTGWDVNCIGLYPDTELVISKEELLDLFKE